MSWGDVTLSDKEFYTLMARYAGVNNLSTVEKYWKAAVEVMIRELYINHTCRCPLIGTFNVKEIQESYQMQKDSNGNERMYKVEPRIIPSFIPHDDFVNDVNMFSVTKKARRRVRRGEMTERDYLRQIRADNFGVVGGISEKRMENSKRKFLELLQQKKQKGKVDLTEDEN